MSSIVRDNRNYRILILLCSTDGRRQTHRLYSEIIDYKPLPGHFDVCQAAKCTLHVDNVGITKGDVHYIFLGKILD